MDASPTIGPFELLEPLGAGGMGEVFKARDTRLQRLVALKFLSDSAGGPARERFRREALAIAAINHPHICTLYEIGEDTAGAAGPPGRPYLVLELLEGETLKARLRRGPLDLEQLLEWSGQIAAALEAAHRRGVLHRDLKPDNIWVTTSGHVKVLDFGLARLESGDPAEAATVTTPLTSPGVAMGTMPYMSPEQARGEVLDVRSDIFSLGAVFYEMASGRGAFTAASAAEVVAGILRGQPPGLRQLRPEMPPRLEQVIERCLEKDPELRFQSAADLRGELQRLRRQSGLDSTAQVAAALAAGRGRRWWWAAVPLAAAAGVAAAIWLRPAGPAPPSQLSFHQLTFNGQVHDAAISPDGKFVAYTEATPQGSDLRLLSIASNSDVVIVPAGDDCCSAPSFSPDGAAVYFNRNGTIARVPMLGGAARTVAAITCASGVTFSPDGSQIAFIASLLGASGFRDALEVARADGSGRRVLSEAPAGSGYDAHVCWEEGAELPQPAWSPDGRLIAVVHSGALPVGHLDIINVASGSSQELGPALHGGASGLAWLPGSRTVLVTAAVSAAATAPQLWAIAVPGGAATRLTNDLQGYANISVAAAGMATMTHAAPQYALWVRDRSSQPFRQLPGGGGSQDGVGGVAWTPQHRLVLIRNLGGQRQVWTEAEDGSGSQVLAATGNLLDPVVAPDGQIVMDADFHTALWRMNADGTALSPLGAAPAGGGIGLPTLIAQGAEVAYVNMGAQGLQTLWAIPLAGGAAHELSGENIGINGNPASPGGNRIFALDAAFTPIIVDLRTHPASVQRVGLGASLAELGVLGWLPDGRAVTYSRRQGTTDNLWAAPLPAGQPYPLTHFTDLQVAAYAFSRDGRLVISRGSDNRDVVLATGLAGAH